MDIIIVIVVILVAAGYLVKRYWPAAKGSPPSCGCDCSGCDGTPDKSAQCASLQTFSELQASAPEKAESGDEPDKDDQGGRA
jgi:hypothetical protein